jgi:hypothetical protein
MHLVNWDTVLRTRSMPRIVRGLLVADSICSHKISAVSQERKLDTLLLKHR